MRLRRSRTRSAALLALLAVVLQGLWPLFAQARAEPLELLPLCTLDGATHAVAVTLRGDAPVPQGGAERRPHCALCVTAGERAAPPPAALAPLALERPGAEHPPAECRAHFDSATRHPAQPRAPPRTA